MAKKTKKKASRSTTTASEANYLKMMVLLREGLSDAIMLLDSIYPNATPAAKRQIDVDKGRLFLARAEAQADLLAAISDSTVVRPPSAAEFAKVQQAARRLDRMNANAATARAVVRATTTLLEAANSASDQEA